MSVATTLLLNRRPRVERQVLALLRGGSGAVSQDKGVTRRFGRLRTLAQREGYVVLPPEVRFLGSDELVLLAWLAMGQRRLTLGCRPPASADLAAAISGCATALEGIKLRLYPLTFYAHCIRG